MINLKKCPYCGEKTLSVRIDTVNGLEIKTHKCPSPTCSYNSTFKNKPTSMMNDFSKCIACGRSIYGTKFQDWYKKGKMQGRIHRDCRSLPNSLF